ncbi:hypothetical protein [Mesorhizobium sp. 10.2.3]|uniref:hypothetical protein n=1 Tax=Mesorhizobium TaxID=68287 RepID=UPI001FEF4E02|nr:hypothetical protein [Mesorhizobium sp. 10.2.3]
MDLAGRAVLGGAGSVDAVDAFQMVLVVHPQFPTCIDSCDVEAEADALALAAFIHGHLTDEHFSGGRHQIAGDPADDRAVVLTFGDLACIGEVVALKQTAIKEFSSSASLALIRRSCKLGIVHIV